MDGFGGMLVFPNENRNRGVDIKLFGEEILLRPRVTYIVCLLDGIYGNGYQAGRSSGISCFEHDCWRLLNRNLGYWGGG